MTELINDFWTHRWQLKKSLPSKWLNSNNWLNSKRWLDSTTTSELTDCMLQTTCLPNDWTRRKDWTLRDDWTQRWLMNSPIAFQKSTCLSKLNQSCWTHRMHWKQIVCLLKDRPRRNDWSLRDYWTHQWLNSTMTSELTLSTPHACERARPSDNH